MVSRLRVFISSPGDVRIARELAAQTVEKVAQDYLRYFTVEPYMWEHEAMLSSCHFQDVIEPPSEFDIVVLILWSRLGTPLPEKTSMREYRGADGRTPVTGTEWEYEEALASTRVRGIPDLLVYRSRERVVIDGWDAARREGELHQLAALDAFWARHFADGGTFLTAYNEFVTPVSFTADFESHLRKLLDRKIAKTEAHASPARIWTKAPFRGLETYDFEHAPIFFGRDDAIGSATLQLCTNADSGCAFLLVLGASGSGKSSLVKAGVTPRLLLPRRVTGCAFLRRVVFRPNQINDGEDIFDGFARALSSDQGRNTGLGELIGPATTVAQLAAHLRDPGRQPGLPFAGALERLAEDARRDGRMLTHEQAKLLVIVDQLEELFTSENVTAQDRLRFITLLDGLARSGCVWVIATMRSDFWHRASETPDLVAMAQGSGRLDLLPPQPAELSQMIRRPAEAAGVRFETDSGGIPLNDRIAEAAAREPGALPLLSYLLDQLYRRDVLEKGRESLSYASYDTLGQLKGSIAAQAETILSAQPEEVRSALRSMLFSLVQISTGEGCGEQISARTARLSAFTEGSAKRRMLELFLDPAARLIVADTDHGAASRVRVAHEALLTEWKRARDCLASYNFDLKIRHMTEERLARFQELKGQMANGLHSMLRRMGMHKEAGLLRDLDLDDAKRLLKNYPDDIAPELAAYITRSADAARRERSFAIRVLSAGSAAMLLLAVGAAVEAVRAYRYADHERAALDISHEQLKTAERVGDTIMLDKSSNTQELARTLYGLEGNLAGIMIKLDPANLNWQHDLASSNARIGWVLTLEGKSKAALPYLLKANAISESLVRLEPGNPDWRADLSAARKLLEGARSAGEPGKAAK